MTEAMNLLLLEPFWSGSHARWASGLKKHSRHHVQLFSMSGHRWKWRMHGGAMTLSREILEQKPRADMILASSMLDLSSFAAFGRRFFKDTPLALYFHENQFTYPWSGNDRDVQAGRDKHYGFIQLSSALAADEIYFNSEYHRSSFLKAAFEFLKGMRDYRELQVIEEIQKKSQVLPLGIELSEFDPYRDQVALKNEKPRILWNHRWEYDKNPEEFFAILRQIKKEGFSFKLDILGQRYHAIPSVFEEAYREFQQEIDTFGSVSDFGKYAKKLWQADIALTTSWQDFFGTSVVEAAYCDCYPILPYRLAYPEHFDDDKPFYHDLNEACEKLRSVLRAFPSYALPKHHVQRYDWKEQIVQYDNTFEDLIYSNPSSE